MGSLCSAEVAQGTKEELVASRKIDSDLKNDAKKRDIKLLLLGAGESGKTTLVKQMKIIYLTGFDEEERNNFKSIIFSNILISMRSLVCSMQQSGALEKLPPDVQKHAASFTSTDILITKDLTADLVEGVKVLWAQQATKDELYKASEFQILDCAKYFLDSVERVTSPGYSPTEEDVLHARTKTVGISEIVFDIENARWRMIDVGGQRGERRKWIHCFQGVTAVIFCVALSEYDMKLREDNNVNRMHESLKLFDEISNCKWFQNTSVILFLNKKDLFQDKVKVIDLKICFDDYTGGLDYEKGVAFIRQKFAATEKNEKRTLYTHVTIATDTNNIKVIFNAVKDTILKGIMDVYV